MLQLLPSGETLTPQTSNPKEAIEYINSYIDNYHCKNMSVDISFVNVIDASYISTVCSTRHFIKYPDGKIEWKVSSELTKDFVKELELGNSIYTI